jgi:hypothetical protein
VDQEPRAADFLVPLRNSGAAALDPTLDPMGAALDKSAAHILEQALANIVGKSDVSALAATS